MKLLGVIYLVTNTVNGKKYVGQTRGTAAKRWNGHRACARAGDMHPLYCAMRLYGEDKFTVVTIAVIVVVGTDEEALKKRRTKKLDTAERQLIKTHNSFIDDGRGYNLTRGGKSGGDVCESTRKKLAAAQRSLGPVSDETRRRCSASGLTRISQATPEARRKGQLNRYKKPAERKWTSQAAINHFNSEAGDVTRQICGEAAQKRWAVEGSKDQQSAKSIAAWNRRSKRINTKIVTALHAGRQSYWNSMTPEERNAKVKAGWVVRKANAAKRALDG